MLTSCWLDREIIPKFGPYAYLRFHACGDRVLEDSLALGVVHLSSLLGFLCFWFKWIPSIINMPTIIHKIWLWLNTFVQCLAKLGTCFTMLTWNGIAKRTQQGDLLSWHRPADRQFDKKKNLVEQPLQRAPEMQNVVARETMWAVSCQKIEEKLLWRVSFHHQKLHCSSSLGSRGPGCPPKSQPGWQAWWEPEENLRCTGIISKSCLCLGTTS